MVEAFKLPSGRYIARKYCSRIADHMVAFRGRYSERWKMLVPFERIEADSVDELNAELRRAGWRLVYG